MTFAEIQQRLAAKFGERIGALAPANKDPFLVVAAGDLVEICRFAKEDAELAFDCLMNLSSVDWPKKNQIEVVYHLWSYSKRHAFVLKVVLDRAQPQIASVESIWKSADWLEREQFDLMGVQFEGHPDLRRIMMRTTGSGTRCGRTTRNSRSGTTSPPRATTRSRATSGSTS